MVILQVSHFNSKKTLMITTNTVTSSTATIAATSVTAVTVTIISVSWFLCLFVIEKCIERVVCACVFEQFSTAVEKRKAGRRVSPTLKHNQPYKITTHLSWRDFRGIQRDKNLLARTSVRAINNQVVMYKHNIGCGWIVHWITDNSYHSISHT